MGLCNYFLRITVLLLTFVSAFGVGSESEIENLVTEFQRVTPSSLEEPKFEETVNRAKNLLRGNPLSTSNSKWLYNQIQAYDRFKKAQESLGQCHLEDKDFSTRMQEALAASFSSVANRKCSYLPTNDKISGIKAIVDSTMSSAFLDQIAEETIKDSVHRLWQLYARYPSNGDSPSIPSLANAICPPNSCDEKIRTIVMGMLKKEASQQTQKVSYAQVKDELFDITTRLNSKIGNIKVPYTANAAGARRQKSEEAYQAYLQYFFTLSKAVATRDDSAGFLLLTNSVQKTFGETIDFDKTDMTRTGGYGRFPLHKTPTEADIKNGIKEAREMTIKQNQLLTELVNNKKKFEVRFNRARPEERNIQDIKKIMEVDPIATANVLMANPQFGDELCKAFHVKAEEDESRKKWEEGWELTYKGLFWGSAALGAASLAALTAPGSVGAIAVAGAVKVASVISTGAAVGFIAHTVGTMNYASKKADDSKRSALAGQADLETFADYNEATKLYYQKLKETGALVALAAIDMGLIKGAYQYVKTSAQGASMGRVLDKVIAKGNSSTKTLIKQTTDSTGNYTANSVDTVVALSKASEQNSNWLADLIVKLPSEEAKVVLDYVKYLSRLNSRGGVNMVDNFVEDLRGASKQGDAALGRLIARLSKIKETSASAKEGFRSQAEEVTRGDLQSRDIEKIKFKTNRGTSSH